MKKLLSILLLFAFQGVATAGPVQCTKVLCYDVDLQWDSEAQTVKVTKTPNGFLAQTKPPMLCRETFCAGSSINAIDLYTHYGIQSDAYLSNHDELKIIFKDGAIIEQFSPGDKFPVSSIQQVISNASIASGGQVVTGEDLSFGGAILNLEITD